MSNMSKYRNMFQDIWLDSPVPYTYGHRYDDFWEKVNEEKRKVLLNCAREFGEDAPWGEISQQLKKTDIDFIREFKDKINWEELGHEIKYDSEIYKEFKKEIDQSFNEKVEFTSEMIDMILAGIN